MNILLTNYNEIAGTVILNGATGPVDDLVYVAQVMTWENERRLSHERQLAKDAPVVKAFNAAMREET